MDYFIKNLWPVIKRDIISILAYLGTIVTVNEVFDLFKIDIPQIIFAITLIVGILVIIIAN